MASVTKGSGKYFWDYERVWTETLDSGVLPFYVGKWGGKIALPDEPTRSTIKDLCEGVKFLPRVPKNRVGCFDVTVTFSKSVSFAAYGLTPPDQWKQWTETFVRVSSPEVKKLVDNQLANSGAQGKIKVPSQGGAVAFCHTHSFLGRPHGHVHYAIPNATCTQDGKMGAIANARETFQDQGVIRARVNKNLDDQLQERGFETKRVGKSVELAKVPKALIEELSPARATMAQLKAQKGFSGPAANDFYARQARQDSGGRVQRTPAEMHRDCKAIGDRYGITLDSLKRDPKVPPPSKDPVTAMSTAYDVAIEARDACSKKYGSFTADQYKERLYTLGIGLPTNIKSLDAFGKKVLGSAKYADVSKEKMPDGTIRYSTKQSQTVVAEVEKNFVREAWGELTAAGKKLGASVLIATTKKAADVIAKISEAVSPQPRVITVDAKKLAKFNRERKPRTTPVAQLKAIGIGLLSPGNPHERAGVAEKVFAKLRRCEHLPRKSIVVVDRSVLANAKELNTLIKIAKRDGASVVLADRPVKSAAKSQAKKAKKQKTPGHSHTP